MFRLMSAQVLPTASAVVRLPVVQLLLQSRVETQLVKNISSARDQGASQHLDTETGDILTNRRHEGIRLIDRLLPAPKEEPAESHDEVRGPEDAAEPNIDASGG